MKRVLLMILDGWGVGKHDHSDAIGSTPTPNITELASNNPRALLYTSGENVGLPDGQMGNSEVGHLNIGAGRVVYQDLVKINRACRDHSIAQNPEIVKAFNYVKENGKQVHFMGLVSNGGVHSSLITCLPCAICRRSSGSRRPLFIALWTVGIRTRRVERVLSGSYRTT